MDRMQTRTLLTLDIASVTAHAVAEVKRSALLSSGSNRRSFLTGKKQDQTRTAMMMSSTRLSGSDVFRVASLPSAGSSAWRLRWDPCMTASRQSSVTARVIVALNRTCLSSVFQHFESMSLPRSFICDQSDMNQHSDVRCCLARLGSSDGVSSRVC